MAPCPLECGARVRKGAEATLQGMLTPEAARRGPVVHVSACAVRTVAGM